MTQYAMNAHTELDLAPGYLEARRRFLNAADSAHARTVSHLNPNAVGAEGEALFCDIAYLGPDHAGKRFIISSGVHGVEGYCGSALQVALLESSLLKSCANEIQFILVHALNPYGFSHHRRTTEDNVDLNRNFLDFCNESFNDPSYEAFRSAAFPDNWKGSSLESIYESVQAYIDVHGVDTFQRHMTKGQYIRSDDPYFGGTQPTWSRKMWEQICAQTAEGSDITAHIDLHSGLGPYGEAEIIFANTPTEWSLKQAKTWYGENNVKVPAHGDSLSPPVSGALPTGLSAATDKAVCIALEFGTVPIDTMLTSLISDNWLSHHPNCPDPLRQSIVSQTRQAFCSDDPDWLSSIWAITRRCVNEGIAGITNS